MLHRAPTLPMFTVSEYSEYINGLVSLEPVIVTGEVSNYRPIPGRKFRYFDIKDDRCVARCFQGLWHSEAVPIENGNQIQVYGFPSMQKNGTFVIDVRDVQLSGAGALMQAYLKLKQQLEEEGLFDIEKKKALPAFPKTIGLIAGKNSSAYHDVTAELTERWKGLTIWFYPSKVQGIGAKQEIVAAIEWFNQRRPVDVLIVARGGGSMEDLQAFDSEPVVRAIFASNIPVISAIGHEDHWTLSDFVADVRAKTPTKAAQVAVPSALEMEERLAYFLQHSQQLLQYQIETKKQSLKMILQGMGWIMQQKILDGRKQIQQLHNRAELAVDGMITAKRNRLEALRTQAQLLNPLSVLDRGYAVVEQRGKRVRKIVDVLPEEPLEVTLSDGQIGASVKKITPFTNLIRN